MTENNGDSKPTRTESHMEECIHKQNDDRRTPRTRRRKRGRDNVRARAATGALTLETRMPRAPSATFGMTPIYFADALKLHMQRHGESSEVLWRAIVGDDEDLDPATTADGDVDAWRRAPRAICAS
jgi:hypothetical protein